MINPLSFLMFYAGLIAAGCALIVLAYVCARAASLGWYRSKLEYLRAAWKLTKGGED